MIASGFGVYPSFRFPIFTDKEERVLKAASHCLKSPPEIDIEKLRVAADFNTTKTASNTWGTIKIEELLDSAETGRLPGRSAE
jgi:hypothetical protein